MKGKITILVMAVAGAVRAAVGNRGGGVPAAPRNTARETHSVSENDTPHTTPLLRKGVSVGYLLVILSHTRNIFIRGCRCGT